MGVICNQPPRENYQLPQYTVPELLEVCRKQAGDAGMPAEMAILAKIALSLEKICWLMSLDGDKMDENFCGIYQAIEELSSKVEGIAEAIDEAAKS